MAFFQVTLPLILPGVVSGALFAFVTSFDEVVIALLNEGLDLTSQQLKGWKPPKNTAPPPKRVCSVKGCGKAYVAKGYCANHYQAWRRGKLES